MIDAKKNTIWILAGGLVLLVLVGYWLSIKSPSSKILFRREIKQIQTQSASDEIEAIEKDLKETDLSDIDKELSDIENELNAAY